MTRGEVYFVDLDPVIGREQSGIRPVLVVSVDRINRVPLVVTVVPGTDAKHIRASYLSNVTVPAGEGGLKKDTTFLGFQIRALDKSRFPAAAAGKLSAERMDEMAEALRYVLGL